MNACQFFLIRYGRFHEAMIDDVVAKVTDAQARVSPVPGLNTIAWLLWHMARTEDCVISRLVGHRPQVFFEQDWAARMNVPQRDFGVGMPPDEVHDLSMRVNLEEATAYWKAVEMRSRAIVDTLSADDLDVVNEPDYIRRVLDEDGMMREDAGEVRAYWPGLPDRSKGFFLCAYGLAHNCGHLSDAAAIRGLYGIRGRF